MRAPDITQTDLTKHVASCLGMLESPLLSQPKWHPFQSLLQQLSNSLQPYLEYLKLHQVARSAHLQRETPSPHFEDDSTLQILPHVPSAAAQALHKETKSCSMRQLNSFYESMAKALSELAPYTHVDLGGILPDDRLARRSCIDQVKKGSLHAHLSAGMRVCLFSVAYNNHLGTRHFVWLLPDSDVNSLELLTNCLKPQESCRKLLRVFQGQHKIKLYMQRYSCVQNMSPVFLRSARAFLLDDVIEEGTLFHTDFYPLSWYFSGFMDLSLALLIFFHCALSLSLFS